MTVSTALNQNVDEIEAVARDVKRLEERASSLRAALLDLLVRTSTADRTDGNDTVLC